VVEYCSIGGMVLAALQDQALVLLLLFGQESCSRGRLEHLADAMVGLGRAFEIFVGADLLANFLTLCIFVSPSTAEESCHRPLCLVKRTCSGVTGFCDVLASSSMVFWSCRRSFLQPTRMMGRPWQKWSTSEIHCNKPSAHWPQC
jgi:hypothetical protein